MVTHNFEYAILLQLEPGSQTEQAPPSAVFWLGPEDMHGFRFLTISVAPRPVHFQVVNDLILNIKKCICI